MWTWFLIFIFAFSAFSSDDLCISSLATRPAELSFDRGEYMAVSLNQVHFSSLLAKAEELEGNALKSRGEAHLTVVTPLEMGKLSPDQRTWLGQKLAALDWEGAILPVCVGSGEVQRRNRQERTYFLVVDAPEIDRLRQALGLGPYYPHITLGFTKTDLHLQDGVIKDRSSCRLPVQIQN